MTHIRLRITWGPHLGAYTLGISSYLMFSVLWGNDGDGATGPHIQPDIPETVTEFLKNGRERFKFF